MTGVPAPMRIFGGHDGGSGCSYYRIELPLSELGRHDGYDVTMADSSDRTTGTPMITTRHLAGHDLIIAQRWNTHKGLEVWRRARGPFTRLVYEVDDDIFSITAENWQAYNLYGDPEIRDAVIHSIEVSDLVTVTTEPLAEVMRQHNPNVAVLGNCVPRWVTGLPREPRLRPRIGWQGAASHGVDIGIIAEPVRRFLRRFPGWDVQLNGTDYGPTLKVPADRYFYAGWTQINDDPESYYTGVDFDIGLCPLWPTDFTRSKSAIKAIEYGARGIPVIASDCEAYRPVIDHGVNGFLVRGDHEWLKYMSELARDDDLRVKMGAAARDMARQHVIEDRWTDWRDAYSGLFK